MSRSFTQPVWCFFAAARKDSALFFAAVQKRDGALRNALCCTANMTLLHCEMALAALRNYTLHNRA